MIAFNDDFLHVDITLLHVLLSTIRAIVLSFIIPDLLSGLDITTSHLDVGHWSNSILPYLAFSDEVQ